MLLEIIKETFGLFFACLVLAFFLHLAIEIVEFLFRKFRKNGRSVLIDELLQYRIAKEPDPFCDPEGYEGFDCPSCHAFLDEEQAFCAECGQKILWKNEDKE